MLFRSPAEVEAMLREFTGLLNKEKETTQAAEAKVDSALSELAAEFQKYL